MSRSMCSSTTAKRLPKLPLSPLQCRPPTATTIGAWTVNRDRKSTRLNSSHRCSSYAVFCLKKKSNIEEKLADAGIVNRLTRISPTVAIHIPWNRDDQGDAPLNHPVPHCVYICANHPYLRLN